MLLALEQHGARLLSLGPPHPHEARLHLCSPARAGPTRTDRIKATCSCSDSTSLLVGDFEALSANRTIKGASGQIGTRRKGGVELSVRAGDTSKHGGSAANQRNDASGCEFDALLMPPQTAHRPCPPKTLQRPEVVLPLRTRWPGRDSPGYVEGCGGLDKLRVVGCGHNVNQHR